MLKISWKMLILGGLIFCALPLFAAPGKTPTTLRLVHLFNVRRANRTLDKLSIRLSTENLKIQNLEGAAATLTRLQEQAKNCVKQAQSKMDKFNELGVETKTGIKENKKLTSLQQYIKQKKIQWRNRRSECRLFVMRSDESITAFMKTVKNLRTKKLLTVKPNFWSNLVLSIQATKKLPKKFNEKHFLQESGIQLINKPLTWSILGTLLVLALIAGFAVNHLLAERINALKLVETFPQKLHLALLSVCKRYSIVLFVFIAFAASMALISYHANHITYLFVLSYFLLGYGLLLALMHFFFCPFRSLQPISGLSEGVARPLLCRLKILATLCLVGAATYVLFNEQNFPPVSINLVHTIFITLLAISIISILWLINRIPKILSAHKILRFFISLILTVSLIVIIAAEWLGYQQLVTYVLLGVTLTLFFGFVAVLLHKIIIGAFRGFTNNESPLPEFLRHQLGVKKHEMIPELIWLHIVFYIVIWGGFTLVLLKIWKLSKTHFRSLIDTLTEGFKVTGMHIVPLHIFSAFIFFIATFLLIRWIRNTIEQHKVDEYAEPGARQAVAAMFGYIGISAALLIALLIAGVNFAGLAIIAGALSVGIGFGLQNIVNNFLSGLILLIERPIKPGDRIRINNEEGFVKRIRIRYTQIRTLKHSDIIVPNSEMISKSVTNLMFRDLYGRVHATVGVAYGSDIELVRKVLLEIAQSHPEIVKDDPMRQPVVFFTEFGDSSLKFDMYCVIRNVNLKFVVRSEINMAINKAFKENNITIAFPQQDIHIKEWPGKI